ncbi:EF-hand domain-containing protein [Streptomyces sp. HNM0574]|uniref:EF-hand domain-containing protein n=1 Tax=Streptomyces sp. HNM0574 TaxID=2714954 RepID=UPI00146EB829|nr:EF-hand domain-containing protein [Streptomyces sp. HNM0574]NLU68264.1 EF-hand domain-containing protein [Streptomyces sp. HNM0574]
MHKRTAVLATVLAAAGVLGATGSALAATGQGGSPPTFHQIDKDNSGTINEQELLAAGQAQGVSKSDVHKAFSKVDTNKDGEMSKKEFVNGARTK